ncbi:hypothetical protein M3Y94_00128200 [Aphelenchoides besseyi]|nr:hypothetical protein M3Y94_00128200 [Aphelenchoides besseyi]KAI6237368.1 hypothetical protein M3Y95_00257500 [Aphelenchoides besseyi]
MERRLNRVRKFVVEEQQRRLLLEEAVRNNRNAKLERVLGCTACSSSIAVDPISGLVAYPCGSTIVINNPKGHTQAHLVSTSKNNITCLAFSPNGRYVCSGEFGQDPMVRVWDLQRDGQTFGQQVAELKEYKFGIACVIFSNDSDQVISVGNQHDKSVVVWDWKSSRKIAESRVSSQVNAIAINNTGKMFVTVGCRHVKFWFLESVNQRTTLQGRSGILSDHRNNTFIDVCCATENRTFAITVAKNLIEFHDKRLVNVYEMNGDVPYSLTLGSGMLFISFGNGRIRGLDVNTAEVLCEAPLPHYLKIDLNDASDNKFFEHNQLEGVNYPDCHSLVYHERSRTLTALYADRSLYHWQFLESGAVVKVSSHLFHVNTVHDLCIVKTHQSTFVPAGTFFTCGADETIRMWSMDKEGQSTVLPSNVLSSELRKVIYLNSQSTTLTEPHGKNFGGIMADTLETTVGIRCLSLNYNGNHLAVGGRNGNITIFDLSTNFSIVCDPIEAHENEIRCLEYSNPNVGRHFLASGSRDRLVHLFDVDQGYAHLTVIEDHSSTVYSVIFIPTIDSLQLITCSTDKLVVLRKQVHDSDGELNFERVKQLSIKNGPNYLVVTPENNLLTAGSDRHIRTYSLAGKELNDVNGTLCDGGTLTKVALDPSGTYAATVCSDRYVYVVDTTSGECAAVLSGQTDGITSIDFTSDCRRLIVVSFSGCIFVWRLSNVLTRKMLSKLNNTTAGNLLSSRSVVDSERCASPDSQIESGSDSASVIGGKKDPRAGSEEFGSLNSLTVVQEDDLDSGVGLRQQPTVVSSRTQPQEQKSFVVRRVPAGEVVRRSNSNLQAALATSTGDLHAEERVDEHDQPAINEPTAKMAQNATAFAVSPQSVPSNYSTSRSMSNLHRNAVSPQRSRRRWAVQNTPPNDSTMPIHEHAPPAYVSPNPGYYQQPMMNMNRSSPYAHQQPIPPTYQQPDSLGLSRFAMSTSMSLNAIRGDLAADTSATYANSAPRPNLTAYPQASPRTPMSASVAFDRHGHSRNSLSKRYLNHSGESPAVQTTWTPPDLRARQPPGATQLYNSAPVNSTRRLSSVGDATLSNSRLYQPRLSNISGNQTDGSRANNRNAGRLWQRRSTVANDEQATVDLPTASASEMFNTLRSRSQSPSQLALQQASKLSATLQRRRDSDARSNRETPTRSNLRAVSNLGNSSQALNKLLATREQLKKSQENLLLAANATDDLGNDLSPISRSRSIGNLKLSTTRLNDSSSRNGLGAFVDDRQMTRSVSSLHHDDPSLRSQYGDDESGGRRQSNVSRSIRDLRKLSNLDLTADDPEKNSSTGDNSTPEPSVFNAYQQGTYYSTTLPKSRKGAVQKRVERNGRLRLDQTTSGDSDSASDAATFGVSPFAKAAAAFQRGTSSSAPFRSVSSMDATRNRPAVSSSTPRRAPNYLAQRLNGETANSDPVDDNSILHDNELTTQSAKGMKMHVQECFDDVKKSVDKLLHAKTIIEKDAQVTEAERERLLYSVYKSINQFRGRLEAALPNDRTFSDLSNMTNGGSGSLKASDTLSRPSNLSNSGVSAQQTTVLPPGELNEDFIRLYGPQLINLLQKNMHKN